MENIVPNINPENSTYAPNHMGANISSVIASYHVMLSPHLLSSFGTVHVLPDLSPPRDVTSALQFPEMNEMGSMLPFASNSGYKMKQMPIVPPEWNARVCLHFPTQLMLSQDTSIFPMLKMLRESGRATFLVTNRLWDYTNIVMNFLCGPKPSDGSNSSFDWLRYFDVVITGREQQISPTSISSRMTICLLPKLALVIILDGLKKLEALNISHCLITEVSPAPEKTQTRLDEPILEKASSYEEDLWKVDEPSNHFKNLAGFPIYTVPDRVFPCTVVDGQRSAVALKRDAAARLPPGVGTRADICVLVRDSQFIVRIFMICKLARLDQLTKDDIKVYGAVLGKGGNSSVLLDVKPWDDETDMKKLEEAVRSVQIEGLFWGASKLVHVCYGIKKLQIMLTIVDDLVSVDDLIEERLTVGAVTLSRSTILLVVFIYYDTFLLLVQLL
ncbi:hypothetical protein K7X08_035911 [Anisodus acutangulus]|uniref:Translation elongation factor EF1B beta/delta subunit guanine nucleotide exchange domain-containing protein n=1 Tax=Anisodus acutangulus TaxID=402998 RepID=A0A9Q1QVR5_9SOLA|nr:hypothetical protein K7X08_035911 [Anisodus acutangulus]